MADEQIAHAHRHGGGRGDGQRRTHQPPASAGLRRAQQRGTGVGARGVTPISMASVDGQVAVVRSRRQGSLGEQETDDVCVRECDREVCAVELVL